MPPPTSEVRRILIVDDELPNRVALERALRDDNPTWEFFGATNEKDGLDIVRNQVSSGSPIDVVLTDLVMANPQGGMTMVQEARRIDPLVMSILFTAKEKHLDRYAAFDHGAFDVVEKNLLGRTAAKEINVKTRAAIRYREWSLKIGFLRRYFDPSVFELLEKDPTLLSLRPATITVAFWDIRGFSGLCEILRDRPQLIAAFLRSYCELGSKTIFRSGGVLDKYIGDGIMALFGAIPGNPMEHDGGIAAVRAAQELLPKFNALVDKSMAEWSRYTPQSIDIGLGCGIHTGEALVGNVGTEFRDQFTALGNVVNFAARIQGRAEKGQILVSQSTEARIRNEVSLTPMGEIADVKNIQGTFKLFRVS